MYFGIFFIIIGALFLLENLGYLPATVGHDIIWPVAVILAGVFLVLRRWRWCHGWSGKYGECGNCKDCKEGVCTDCKCGTCSSSSEKGSNK